MSKYAKLKLDPYGVVKDTDPHDVDSEWTSVQNMRFNDLAAEKMGGEVQATLTAQQAYHLQFNGNHSNPLWVYTGDTYVASTDFTTETDLSAGVTIASGVDWDSTLFNTLPVLNNTVDPPWYWDNVLTNDIAPLPAFPANTLCQAIRPYRSFLIALNITESSVEQPNRLIWSDSSDAGALPASWDIADPATLAGDAYLTSSRGEIIDGLQLRDLFVIYKSHAVYILRLVGGASVMRVDKIQINSGILAKNCVQEFKGTHFVVSDADVVLFDGQSIKSIADKRVRAEIFGNIDTVNYRNTYTVRYDRQDEMWICYPTSGQTVPNKAAIWNWKDDTWTFRDLDQSYHMASGLANFAISPTYQDALFTYASAEAQVPYQPVANNPTTDTLVNAVKHLLGNEISRDVGFDAPGVWSVANATVSGSQLTLNDTSTASHNGIEDITPGKRYEVTVDVASTTGAGFLVLLGGVIVAGSPITVSGTYIITAENTVVDKLIGFNCGAGSTALINSASIKTAEESSLNIIDEGFNLYDIAMPSSLEKTSMTLGDEDQIKIIKSVTPKITADTGTKVYIRIGKQMNPDDQIMWSTEQLYTVGVDREAFFTCKARYISIRFRTQDADVSWKCHGFYLKAALSGKH